MNVEQSRDRERIHGRDTDRQERHTIKTVSAKKFYAEYHGHPTEDLEVVHQGLKRAGKEKFIWLCGDSSLDNKHWIPFQTELACNGISYMKPSTRIYVKVKTLRNVNRRTAISIDVIPNSFRL